MKLHTAVNTDELRLAMEWYRKLSPDYRVALAKAMRSVDACNVDGTRVLIATFRMVMRQVASR
jgi:hypothetical protein